ncbi:hypothetical protein [Nocardia sp. Marseille-Q1738]
MTAPDSLDRRRAIAAHLNKIPTSCPADTHEWAETGRMAIEDDYGTITFSPQPDTSSGVYCALAAAVHKHGCCWCGKFRTGLEVSDGRA